MKFNEHSKLEGKHAFLSASSYHWINYDLEKLETVYRNDRAKRYGIELHELACRCIRLGTKLARTKTTLNMYVNDAISFRMTPEQVLYYSDNCFGTADAISFRDGFLRIHDFKSGVVQASMHQLEVYAALFCLEYEIDPRTIHGELRIYQSNEIVVHEFIPEDIQQIMDKIIAFDERINELEKEG